MAYYLLENALPLLAELLFITGAVLLPGRFLVYLHFLFCLLIYIYFRWKRSFSSRAWKYAAQDGESFWGPVLSTAGAIAVCFLLTGMIPGLQNGMFKMQIQSWLEILLFAVSSLFLAPIAEELLFRKSLISTKTAGSLVITALISLLLFALEQGVTPGGVLTALIWGIPLTVSYIRTRNIYIPMTAHLLCSLISSGVDLISLISFKLY